VDFPIFFPKLEISRALRQRSSEEETTQSVQDRDKKDFWKTKSHFVLFLGKMISNVKFVPERGEP